MTSHGQPVGRLTRFALCGCSARKVRRGAANLLGGRAVRYELFGLSAAARVLYLFMFMRVGAYKRK